MHYGNFVTQRASRGEQGEAEWISRQPSLPVALSDDEETPRGVHQSPVDRMIDIARLNNATRSASRAIRYTRAGIDRSAVFSGKEARNVARIVEHPSETSLEWWSIGTRVYFREISPTTFSKKLNRSRVSESRTDTHGQMTTLFWSFQMALLQSRTVIALSVLY